MNNDPRSNAARAPATYDEPIEIDPVCGMELPRSAAPVDANHEGQRFYFCCDACKARFEREPARYCVSYIEMA